MRKLAIVVAAAVCCWAGAAAAQTTTSCNGDTCTIEADGSPARQMTPAEVRKHFRQGSFKALDGVRCKHTDHPDRCERIIRELRLMTVY